MDEREYLKTKEKIKEYRCVSPLGILFGGFFLTLSFSMLFSGMVDLEYSLVVFSLSVFLIVLGLWANSKARKLGIEIEVYDKEREWKKAQHPVSPAAVGSTAKLQYCPSCGKKLQPDWKLWKLCGYCGKRLKKSDS